MQNHYGYCRPECIGQTPSKSRPEHLTRPGFDQLWSSRIFHLHTWKAGLCHTYTPNETYFAESKGQLYALLGNGKERRLAGYEIYLHPEKVTYNIVNSQSKLVVHKFVAASKSRENLV